MQYLPLIYVMKRSVLLQHVKWTANRLHLFMQNAGATELLISGQLLRLLSHSCPLALSSIKLPKYGCLFLWSTVSDHRVFFKWIAEQLVFSKGSILCVLNCTPLVSFPAEWLRCPGEYWSNDVFIAEVNTISCLGTLVVGLMKGRRKNLESHAVHDKPKPQAAKVPLWNLWLPTCFFLWWTPRRGIWSVGVCVSVCKSSFLWWPRAGNTLRLKKTCANKENTKKNPKC